MIPVSRPYPLPRDAFWLNPVSPQIPSTFDQPSLDPVPVSDPHKEDPGASRAARIDIRESEARRSAAISNVNEVQISRCFSVAWGKATGSLGNRHSLVDKHRQPPLASGRSMLTL